MLQRTDGGSTMDTGVATQADAPRRRGTKFKLTYRQICELRVAKGPVEGKQGRVVIASRPSADTGKPYRVLDGNQGCRFTGPKRVAAVHALFLSHYPQSLPFERFQYLYMALDGCFQLISAKGGAKSPRSHGERIQWMCAAFDMPVPDWARHATAASSSLSVVRNNAFHEGLFFGEPLGFSIYGGNQPAADFSNTTLQMQALVSRPLVAILGKPEASYIKSAVYTHQRHGLNLRE